MNLDSISALVATELRAVEEALRDGSESVIPLIPDVAKHTFGGGGKRIRPLLVLLSARLCGYRGPRAVQIAAAVEMLHTATLIHDDLVDEAPLRRGRKTLHTLWPAGATVLAGYYLLAQAASLIAETEHPRILKVFAETLCTMCAGEIRQIFITKGKQSHSHAAVE